MRINRRAGESTRRMASQRRAHAWLIAIIGLAVMILLFLFVKNATVLGISGVGVLVLIVFMRLFGNFVEGLLDKKKKMEQRAIRGAKAEEKVGELLDGLPEEQYFYLNDVESPYGNIDHVVFSKSGGIYLLETKAHGGRVEVSGGTLLVNGSVPEKNFIAQALQNSYWLREKLGQLTGQKQWITPVVVFTNAFVTRTKPVKGVHVINKKYLLQVLGGARQKSSSAAQIWDMRVRIAGELLGS